jgi:AcrR family transcriptional regulator
MYKVALDMSARPKPSAVSADRLEVVVDDEPDVEPTPRRRRGRPAESDGLTRERILIAARVCFAESGYAAASTHMVAARVGLTTGALYHHFASKRDLYLAVVDEVEAIMLTRIQAVAAPHARFADKFGALLDEIVRLTRDEPTITSFLQSVTADLGRHPELDEGLMAALEKRSQMLAELVDTGIARGELAEADRDVVFDTVTSMLIGLLALNMNEQIPGILDRAVDGYKRLVEGSLVKTKRRR